MAKRRKTLLVLLGTLIGVIVLVVIVFALSFPSLAAPVKPIPKSNPVQNQLALQNLETKLRASALGILASNGSLRITLSENELNAILNQYLSQKLRGDVRFLGSATTITAAKTISCNLAVKWHGYTLGLQGDVKPVVLPDGRVNLLLSELRLGKLPLPKTYLLDRLKDKLPRAVAVTQAPPSLIFNPNALIAGNYPPIIKDPRISVQRISLVGNNLQLVAQVYFRLW